MTIRNLLLALAVGLMLCGPANTTSAQCSRARSGGGAMPSGSNGGLTRMRSPSLVSSQQASVQQSYMNDRILAMRNQMLLNRQQMLAMRQQQYREQLQTQSEQQQDLLAMRRTKAEAKRSQRAERIAANRLRYRRSPSPTGPDSDQSLVAYLEPNPFAKQAIK